MVFFNVGKLDYRIYRYELCVNAALYLELGTRDNGLRQPDNV